MKPVDLKGSSNNSNIPYVWFWLSVVIITGVFLAYFHNMFVFRGFRPVNMDILSDNDNRLLERAPELSRRVRFVAKNRETRLIWLGEKESAVPFYMEEPHMQRVKLRGFFPKVTYAKARIMVFVNGRLINTLSPDWKGDFERFDFYIPRGAFKSGENTFVLNTSGTNKYVMGLEGINLRNFAGRSKNFPRAVVLFDGNYMARGLKPFKKPLDYLLFPFSMFLAWIIPANLMRVALKKPLGPMLKKMLFWYIPVAAILLIFAVFSWVTEFTLILHPDSFFSLVFAPAAVAAVYGLPKLAYVYLKGSKTPEEGVFEQEGMVKDEAPAPLPLTREASPSPNNARFKRLLKFAARFGSKAAVVGFALFLSAAGVLLIVRNQGLAETMADIAYFLLVFGVLIRFFDVERTEE